MWCIELNGFHYGDRLDTEESALSTSHALRCGASLLPCGSFLPCSSLLHVSCEQLDKASVELVR